MQVVRKVATPLVTAAVTAMAACASSEAPAAPHGQDISFVGGCWVQKDAASRTVQAVLRLLPDNTEESDRGYAGDIQRVTLGELSIPEKGLRFARDGSTASYWFSWPGYSSDADVGVIPGGAVDYFVRDDHSSRKAGSSRYRAIFRSKYDRERTLTVEARADRLKIWRETAGHPPREAIFDGERDGCD